VPGVLVALVQNFEFSRLQALAQPGLQVGDSGC
jgi:hypothetical protein